MSNQPGHAGGAEEAQASAPVLAFRDVYKFYVRSHLGRTTRSRGIEALNLAIEPGEIFGLLGLNGSGKTTTLKLALGLLKPTRGEISVFGRPAGRPDSLALMGFLPELPYFYPYMTPNEILRFYGRLSGMAESALLNRISRALERVGLIAHSERRLSEFSKGMLQRVGLAQAMLHEPGLILLDEPAGGLDPLAVADFRRLFKQLNEEGTTLLLSSHSISEVERLCHRVGILVSGKLVRILRQKDWSRAPGTLEELFVETVRKGSGIAAGEVVG